MKHEACSMKHKRLSYRLTIYVSCFMLYASLFMFQASCFITHAQSSSQFQIISPEISIESPTGNQSAQILQKRIGKAQAESVLSGNVYIEYDKGSSCSYLQKPDTLIFGSNSGIETQKLTVGVKSGINGPASLQVMEKSNLKLVLGNKVIPETQCNDGSKCTSLVAQKWTDPASYGWGVRAQSTYAPLDFKSKANFRPFSKEFPRTVLSGTGNGPIEGILEIKINKTSGLMGSYSGAVEMTASCE